MSGPTVEQSSLVAYTASSATTVSGAQPANTTSQLLFAFVCASFTSSSPSVTFTKPDASWTLISAGLSNEDPQVVSGFYTKPGDASQASVTWTFNKACRNAFLIMGAIDQAALSSPVDVSGIAAGLQGLSSININSITTTNDNELVIACFGLESNPALTTEINFTPSSGNALSELLNSFSGDILVSINAGAKSAHGSTGSKTGSAGGTPPGTISAVFAANTIVAIKPYPGPSIPTLIAPPRAQSNGAAPSITKGAVFNLGWAASTSPTAAQSSLKYHIQVSPDNGVTWSDVVALTSAGVTTYAWNTGSLAVGSNYLVRIRSFDPAISTYSTDYDVSLRFSIVAEVAPNAPTNLSPNGGAVNKAIVTPLSWLDGGGSGNPQTEATYRWSRDGFVSHDSGDIVVSGSTPSTTKDFSAEAVGIPISWKVKTKGVTLYSAFSAVATFVVANKPATPNITAPTAGSPPTVPLPTVTFTESDAFTAYRVRFVTGGNEVFNSGWVTSSALSFVSPYPLANGVSYTMFLAVRNQYGLESSEDSETFTPSYSGPTAATATATANSAGGYIRIQISNTGSISYNEIWRYKSTETRSNAVRVATLLGSNAFFDDYNLKSGVTYKYFIRTYNSSGLFTDST